MDNEVDETVHSVFLLQELPDPLPCSTAGVSHGVLLEAELPISVLKPSVFRVLICRELVTFKTCQSLRLGCCWDAQGLYWQDREVGENEQLLKL